MGAFEDDSDLHLGKIEITKETIEFFQSLIAMMRLTGRDTVTIKNINFPTVIFSVGRYSFQEFGERNGKETEPQ